MKRFASSIIATLAALTLLTTFTTGCAVEAPTFQTATIDDVSFAVPLDWQPLDQSEVGRASVTWRATPTAHASKASVTVVRTRPAGVDRATPNARIISLLQQAQQSLPDGNFGAATIIHPTAGVDGVQIIGDFQPSTTRERYQRIHTIVRVATGLVHVLYTAPVGTLVEAQAAYTQALAHLHIKAGA
jgi:hypothetical protein